MNNSLVFCFSFVCLSVTHSEKKEKKNECVDREECLDKYNHYGLGRREVNVKLLIPSPSPANISINALNMSSNVLMCLLEKWFYTQRVSTGISFLCQ